jgi:mevalonate kinase
MKQEDYDKMVKQFDMPGDPPGRDSAIVEGLTPGFTEYQKEMIKRRMDELQYLIVHTIEVMQARNNEQMGVIGELMRQNQVLKDKLKEKENDQSK